MPSHLDAVVSLQTTLDDLEAAELRLNTIPDWMQELHAEHSAQLEAIQQLADAGAEADRERREAEASLSDSQEKLKHYQEQIGQVSNQREYGAKLTEIDAVKEQIATAEKTSLDAFERNEEAQQKVKELKEEFKELDKRYKAELKKWEAQKPAVAKNLKALKAQAKSLKESIPRGILRNFERIRLRLDGVAVAPVLIATAVRGSNIMWHCGACNYNVRPQVVVEIRNKGDINQCESCKRLLYCPPEPEQDDA